jgi:hypothetical protein
MKRAGPIAVGAVVIVGLWLFLRGGEPTQAPPAAKKKTPSPVVTPTPTLQPLSAVDDEDDPNHPEFTRLFPQSGDVSKWVKVKPITVVEAGLPTVEGGRTQFCEGFLIQKGGTATYAQRFEDVTHHCTLLIVETVTPSDAYGLFTVSTTDGEPAPYGVSWKTSPWEFHLWRENLYVMVRGEPVSEPGEEDAANAVKDLAAAVLFDREKPSPPSYPDIRKFFPNENMIATRQMFIRSLSCLEAPGAAQLMADLSISETDRETIGGLLRLGPDNLLGISAYRVPDAVRPNYVWIVSYEDPNEATSALSDYQRAIDGGTTPLARTTLIKRGSPQILIGTWTAEEESLTHTIQQIATHPNLGGPG